MINVIVFLALLVGVVFLQIFLSKKENMWYGLVLPIISLVNPILAGLGLSTFTAMKSTSKLSNGEILVESVSYSAESLGSVIIQMILVSLYASIPTIILLLIYFACRQKFKKNRELNKMKIDDL